MSPAPDKKLASELESREVAEAAREEEWEHRSFAKGLFDGRVALDLIDPLPDPDPDEQAVKFVGGPFSGTYRDYFSGESIAVSDGTTLVLPPWGYRVLVQ